MLSLSTLLAASPNRLLQQVNTAYNEHPQTGRPLSITCDCDGQETQMLQTVLSLLEKAMEKQSLQQCVVLVQFLLDLTLSKNEFTEALPICENFVVMDRVLQHVCDPAHRHDADHDKFRMNVLRLLEAAAAISQSTVISEAGVLSLYEFFITSSNDVSDRELHQVTDVLAALLTFTPTAKQAIQRRATFEAELVFMFNVVCSTGSPVVQVIVSELIFRLVHRERQRMASIFKNDAVLRSLQSIRSEDFSQGLRKFVATLNGCLNDGTIEGFRRAQIRNFTVKRVILGSFEPEGGPFNVDFGPTGVYFSLPDKDDPTQLTQYEIPFTAMTPPRVRATEMAIKFQTNSEVESLRQSGYDATDAKQAIWLVVGSQAELQEVATLLHASDPLLSPGGVMTPLKFTPTQRKAAKAVFVPSTIETPSKAQPSEGVTSVIVPELTAAPPAQPPQGSGKKVSHKPESKSSQKPETKAAAASPQNVEPMAVEEAPAKRARAMKKKDGDQTKRGRKPKNAEPEPEPEPEAMPVDIIPSQSAMKPVKVAGTFMGNRSRAVAAKVAKDEERRQRKKARREKTPDEHDNNDDDQYDDHKPTRRQQKQRESEPDAEGDLDQDDEKPARRAQQKREEDTHVEEGRPKRRAAAAASAMLKLNSTVTDIEDADAEEEDVYGAAPSPVEKPAPPPRVMVPLDNQPSKRLVIPTARSAGPPPAPSVKESPMQKMDAPRDSTSKKPIKTPPSATAPHSAGASSKTTSTKGKSASHAVNDSPIITEKAPTGGRRLNFDMDLENSASPPLIEEPARKPKKSQKPRIEPVVMDTSSPEEAIVKVQPRLEKPRRDSARELSLASQESDTEDVSGVLSRLMELMNKKNEKRHQNSEKAKLRYEEKISTRCTGFKRKLEEDAEEESAKKRRRLEDVKSSFEASCSEFQKNVSHFKTQFKEHRSRVKNSIKTLEKLNDEFKKTDAASERDFEARLNNLMEECESDRSAYAAALKTGASKQHKTFDDICSFLKTIDHMEE